MLLNPWLVHQGKFGWPSGINLMGELAGFKGCCVMGGHQGWVSMWITRYQYIVDIDHCKVVSRSRCTLIRKPREKQWNIESREERDRHLEKRIVGGKINRKENNRNILGSPHVLPNL